MAQLSNAVVQPASMLAKPSSMLAQLRIWIGYGSDLVFERRPETSSTARFSKEAGRPETKGEPPPNQGRNPVQSKGENLPPLVSDAPPLVSPLDSEGSPLVSDASPLVSPLDSKGSPLDSEGSPLVSPLDSKGSPLVSDASPLDSPLVLVPPLVSRPWFWAFALGLELQIQGRSN